MSQKSALYSSSSTTTTKKKKAKLFWVVFLTEKADFSKLNI